MHRRLSLITGHLTTKWQTHQHDDELPPLLVANNNCTDMTWTNMKHCAQCSRYW